jgi:hypothetical protein
MATEVNTAKVVKAFVGAPDGEVYPRDFAPGDMVHGDLAAVAMREGWAKPVKTGKAATED